MSCNMRKSHVVSSGTVIVQLFEGKNYVNFEKIYKHCFMYFNDWLF
jgi:hypothetical protein